MMGVQILALIWRETLHSQQLPLVNSHTIRFELVSIFYVSQQEFTPVGPCYMYTAVTVTNMENKTNFNAIIIIVIHVSKKCVHACTYMDMHEHACR